MLLEDKKMLQLSLIEEKKILVEDKKILQQEKKKFIRKTRCW